MAARPHIKRDVDLTDRTAKRDLQSEIGRLGGLYEVSIKPVRLTRSTQQNRYWHGVVVREFHDYLAAQGQHFTHDQCHEYLRDRFIPRAPILDVNTGEVLDYMPASSAALDVSEFMDFVVRVREWLEETFNIIVPDPAPPAERSQRTKYPPEPAMHS